jgi:CRISPR system Cascade subunit CasE
MFLTRFEINRARRGCRKLLGSPQAMHAAVRAAFPGEPAFPGGPEFDGHEPLGDQGPLDEFPPRTTPPDTDVGRLLWRVDDDGRRAVLYVVSTEKPDLTHLVEQAGWPTHPQGWVTRAYEPFLSHLSSGQHWAFRLQANPTHAVKLEGRKRSQRLGHVTVAQQVQWLLTRAESRGFRVLPTGHADPASGEPAPALVVHHRQVRGFRRRDQPQSQRRSEVTLTMAVFDGHLEILDADRLRETLTRGIGPAKAYGCGLLTLAKPRSYS